LPVPPAEFYAGWRYWQSQWTWLSERRHRDPALEALFVLDPVGPRFRLAAAQNRWSAAWLARGRPVERLVSEVTLNANAWALEDLATERARICKAAFAHSPDLQMPPNDLGTVTPQGSPSGTLVEETGTLARVGKHGTEWRVTRRDWTEIIESVPPCKRVRCSQIDCEMVEGGGWEDVCTKKVIHRFTDHSFVLHFDAAPVTPRVGDLVKFFWDADTGHAVLSSAARRAGATPYFSL
jgi:hypothetical protein